jgi:endonuclease/exonuclease/phosphatase family metal-dependent hydrolase
VWKEALRAYRNDFRVRAEQARVLKQHLKAEPHPFIVCGDFNSTPYTWVYAHVTRGLQDAFSQKGRGWSATYPARFPLVRIDYILASKEWGVRGAHVDRTVSSDHLPVVAELVLSPSAVKPNSGGD